MAEPLPPELRDLDLAVPLWGSAIIGVLELDRNGVVQAANEGAERMLVRSLGGMGFDALVSAAQRHDIVVEIATASDRWLTRFVGLAPDEREIPTDFVMHLRAMSADRVAVVLEPAWWMDAGAADRLAAVVAELLGQGDSEHRSRRGAG